MPSFSAARQNKPDTFEKQSSKMSNNIKWGVGLGLTALGTILVVALSKRKNASSNTIKQFAEHIDFKEAKSMEDAKKFAMDNFGMKLDVNNNLTAANFFNEICTNVNNKFKGKARLPEIIQFKKGDNGKYNNMSWTNPTKSLNVYEAVAQVLLNLADKKKTNILKDGHNELLILSAYHELGHAQHFAYCKKAASMSGCSKSSKVYKKFMNEINEPNVNKACKSFFSSDYYATDPAEFVAETFAWKMMGKTTPKEIEELYLKYGGIPF